MACVQRLHTRHRSSFTPQRDKRWTAAVPQHKGEASRGVQTAVCVPRPRHHFHPLGFLDVRVIIVLGRARAHHGCEGGRTKKSRPPFAAARAYCAPQSSPRREAAAATVHVLLTYPIDRPYRPEYYALRWKRRVMCLPPNKGPSGAGGARSTSVGGEDPLLCTLVRARPPDVIFCAVSLATRSQPATAVAFTMQAAASQMEAAAVAYNGNIAPATRPSTLTAVCWYVYIIRGSRRRTTRAPSPTARYCRCKRKQFFFFSSATTSSTPALHHCTPARLSLAVYYTATRACLLAHDYTLHA